MSGVEQHQDSLARVNMQDGGTHRGNTGNARGVKKDSDYFTME